MATPDEVAAVDMAAVDAAARLLEQGALVAFPTETVYGLGADASNPEAVAKIFKAKGRPSNHPVIVHLAANADVALWARSVPPLARQLIECFWPGPLTLILPSADSVPAAVTGGQPSVGLRCPAHPLAQALLQNFRGGQGGLAAPSANRFGHVSPTTAQHVTDEFGLPGQGPLAAVLDGGACSVGIESSILDLTRLSSVGPVLLRPGQITAEQLAQVIGAMPALPDLAAPRVSGSLAAHYAPNTPVVLLASEALIDAVQRLQQRAVGFSVMAYSPAMLTQHASELEASRLWRMPEEAEGYAQALYASLRALDARRMRFILIEQPPHSLAWQGVNDRLQRAAFDSAGVLEKLLALG
jgi:L-threonylcarbamoyladenylate synthase